MNIKECEKRSTLRKQIDCFTGRTLILFAIVAIVVVVWGFSPAVVSAVKNIKVVRLEACSNGILDCVWQKQKHKKCNTSWN